jgi:hypothetical protein
MTSNDLSFGVLHVLRIKGLADLGGLTSATGASPEEVAPALGELTTGLLVIQPPGRTGEWMLTTAGLEKHAQLLDAQRTPELLASVAAGYESFLDLNAPAKSLVTAWQQGVGDAAVTLESLADIQEDAAEALLFAARGATRFGRYADRLETALVRAQSGDSRYVTDPLLDSYHTVWFECHEDFLLTLGRSRAEESP